MISPTANIKKKRGESVIKPKKELGTNMYINRTMIGDNKTIKEFIEIK